MAKDLVRTRAACKKFMIMKANIQAVSLKITTLKSNHAMAQAMKGVTKAMATMNKTMKLPEIQKIMMEFEKQSELMDMKEEMMDDAIDSALGDDDDEIESDKVVTQVLDELGIELTGELASKLFKIKFDIDSEIQQLRHFYPLFEWLLYLSRLKFFKLTLF